MKYQMFTLFLLIISSFFFKPTHQYRLSKRELTEYDLTSFIVSTCSASTTDMLIQNLCDQTLQSALMGNFPSLTHYCMTMGVGMTYCNTFNQRPVTDQNAGAKRFAYPRPVRSPNEDRKLYHKGQEMDNEADLEQKLIIQLCIFKIETSEVDTDQFCNRTLQQVMQGQYPEIERLCEYYSGFDYCRHIRSYSLFSWPLSKFSSLLSSVSTSSITPKNNPLLASSSPSKSSDIESLIDQQMINKQN
jgi:hypothetical protein